MATEAAQEKYSRRRHPGERPFAVIKHQFGARRFLLRGLAQVNQEWLCLSAAFVFLRPSTECFVILKNLILPKHYTICSD